MGVQLKSSPLCFSVNELKHPEKYKLLVLDNETEKRMLHLLPREMFHSHYLEFWSDLDDVVFLTAEAIAYI